MKRPASTHPEPVCDEVDVVEFTGQSGLQIRRCRGCDLRWLATPLRDLGAPS